MSKFTNVDYNKNLIYDDSNPFAETWKEKHEEGKNLAIQAYEKKVDSTVQESMYDMRKQLMGPRYEELILNRGTDAEMLNPKFYDLMNASPESILEDVRANAGKYGINPKSIKPGMVMTDELKQMRESAVRQHYDELARYADENGNAKLQKLLDREGDKFATFYRKFTDPYISESRGALWVNTGPGAEAGAQQRSLAKKYPHLAEAIASGTKFEEHDGKIYQTTGFVNNLNYLKNQVGINTVPYKEGVGSQVFTDSDGRRYIKTGSNPLGALFSNVFGSGNVDMKRQYIDDDRNPDEWFWWAH